ncbi:Ca2+-binding actin-bundling protein (actinin), alpha chain (EF-Hand protein super) [Homalodisca vitripennis]|nr:Ca2+-binding actin-bundling protein (actinin), alpha chain (EF-Hand protein super) [Homalodisca vitripennis]
MGNRSSLLLREEEIAQIQEETGFTPNQIERLYSRFTSLDRGDCGTLSREDFLRIPELAINPLGDRIVHAFFDDDSGSDRVNFRQFMQVLARFRPIKKMKDNKLNSREQKLKFAFKMYDLDNDDMISRDELLAILHMMVGANIRQTTNMAAEVPMKVVRPSVLTIRVARTNYGKTNRLSATLLLAFRAQGGKE